MKTKILGSLVVVMLGIQMSFGATTQKWTAGWDNFSVPLNYSKSFVTWSVNSETNAMNVTYSLTGAVPNSFYGAGMAIFCEKFPATFGQFPVSFLVNGECTSFDRQGVTKTAVTVLFGVILTDLHGNGSFTVTVGPIKPASYDVEFAIVDTGGSLCDDNGIDFQSPGPVWGDGTTITIP
jgi:hypothetical protein